MGFIQYNDRVSCCIWIDDTLSLEHTISHELDPRLWACAILKTDGITHFLSKSTTDLLGYSICHGRRCYTARLSTPNLSVVCRPRFGEVLHDLSSLPRTCVTNHYQDLMLRSMLVKLTLNQNIGKPYLPNSLQKRFPKFIYW
jgi:hypothetical protein